MVEPCYLYAVVLKTVELLLCLLVENIKKMVFEKEIGVSINVFGVLINGTVTLHVSQNYAISDEFHINLLYVKRGSQFRYFRISDLSRLLAPKSHPANEVRSTFVALVFGIFLQLAISQSIGKNAVSYTHLTLPTIYSV